MTFLYRINSQEDARQRFGVGLNKDEILSLKIPGVRFVDAVKTERGPINIAEYFVGDGTF
jgi:hypothetical protein